MPSRPPGHVVVFAATVGDSARVCVRWLAGNWQELLGPRAASISPGVDPLLPLRSEFERRQRRRRAAIHVVQSSQELS
jgi:hypothetical protein